MASRCWKKLKIWLLVSRQYMNVTDGHDVRHRPRLCIASSGKKERMEEGMETVADPLIGVPRANYSGANWHSPAFSTTEALCQWSDCCRIRLLDNNYRHKQLQHRMINEMWRSNDDSRCAMMYCTVSSHGDLWWTCLFVRWQTEQTTYVITSINLYDVIYIIQCVPKSKPLDVW